MRRVLVITNSLSGGGAERSANILCRELKNQSLEIALMPINSGPLDLIDCNCQILAINRKYNSGIFVLVKSILNYLIKLLRFRPDTIILNCDLPEFFGCLTPFHCKIIAVEHSPKPWQQRRRIGIVVRKILKLRKVVWIAVSPKLRIWPDNSIPFAVISNPVEFNSLRIANQTKLKRLFYVGRLSPEKNPLLAVEIAISSGLPIEVIGDGELMKAIQSISIKNTSVVLRGYQTDPWKNFEPGDLVLLTSAWEGDGIALLEAINMDAPILVIDNPDFRFFELPERNYCLGKNDFLEKINSYKLNLLDLKIPANIRSRILENRNPTDFMQQWLKVIESKTKTH